MDSGTHLVFGLGLGGLALTDPVIASHPYGPIAVLIGTVLGSQAPDIDTLLRFKSNADYIKNHRGLSHSIPAVLGWAVLITLALAVVFPDVSWLHLGAWVLLAVVVHVVTDLFNSYGTQAARPVSKRWIAWNIIHIFDPFIFLSHLAAIVLWATGWAEPRAIFPVLYGILAVYYGWRTWVHHRIESKLQGKDEQHRPGDRYFLLPTLSLHRWNVIRESKDCKFGIGEYENGKLIWLETTSCAQHPAIEASKTNKDVQSFLALTPFPCGQVTSHSWGYEVRWLDIRYRHRRQYPFVAVVMMDRNYEALQSYVGWLSDDRLQKRLRMNTY
ncbi:metal-dependent hydrolase [Cohnella thailandensis]|uniref:Metal-dependent hydrolase n=1 Tax=Cohnella thailandensis TaxID=557557 RepID=A0A841SRP0_9BACL|nr:metal-dependent hydrolase [Cohnella thailandensis]MBB6632735.1 metal-dependent hydrolase [Cohnella thailandensis]MBP1975576.1 inner membrane protein [Cohnella thailandensis]